MPRRTPAVFLVAALAMAITPAAAQAASIIALPCARVVLGEKTVPVGGTGFTPDSFVRLTTPDGTKSLGGASTDAAGNFGDVFFGASLFPSARSTETTLQLVGTDSAGIASAPITLRIVRIGAKIPARARPGSRVTYKVTGFSTGKAVYLHVRRGGRTRGTFKIGTAQGDCGVATRRLRYMPLKRYVTGRYDYYFQHSSKFNPTAPRVKLSLNFFRRIRFG